MPKVCAPFSGLRVEQNLNLHQVAFTLCIRSNSIWVLRNKCCGSRSDALVARGDDRETRECETSGENGSEHQRTRRAVKDQPGYSSLPGTVSIR